MSWLDNSQVECQPCDSFTVFDTSVLGHGPQPHQCPICSGWRYFCGNCYTDHHDGGWNSCNLHTVCPRNHPECMKKVEAKYAKES